MRHLRTSRRDVIALRCDEGSVVCPARGTIDVERCWQCLRFLGMRDGDHGRSVVCAPPRLGGPFGTVVS